MAVKTIEQAGAQSVTFSTLRDPIPGSRVVLTLSDWQSLPPGKLRDLMTPLYLKPNGEAWPEEFTIAFAKAGASASYMACTASLIFDVPEWGMVFNPGDVETYGAPIGSVLLFVPYTPDPALPVVARLTAAYSASE